jgi:outer membrane protein
VKRPLFILALFLILQPAASASAPPPRKLTLQECIAIAMKNATAVRKAENNLEATGADVLRSYGSFLPKISATAGYSPRSVKRGITYDTDTTQIITTKTESEPINVGLTASINLFNGLSDYAALRSAIELKQASGLTLQRAREFIVYDITQHYYQALLDRELAAIAAENLQTSGELLTLTDRQYRIGLKSLADLYQQQAEVAANSLTAITAENQSRRSLSELLRRLRIDPLTPFDIEPAAPTSAAKPPGPADADSLAALGLQRRADLEAGRRQAEAARWQVKEAAGARLPKLDLALSLSSDATNYYSSDGVSLTNLFPGWQNQLENSFDYGISLNLNWSIFDGFQTRYAVQSAKAAMLNSRLDYEELRDGIVLDIRQTSTDYRAAFTRLDAATASVRAADAAFGAVQRKYELGATGFVELSAARTTRFNARSGLTQAMYNLALQRALLDHLTGTPITE